MQDIATLIQILLAAAAVAAPIVAFSVLIGKGEPVSLSVLYGAAEPPVRGIQEEDAPRWRLEVLDQRAAGETSPARPEQRPLRRRQTVTYEPGR